MDSAGEGIVLFGDVVGSRRAPEARGAWLRALCYELDDLYGGDRLAGFGFTQGDELQGLLKLAADPLRAVLHGSLHAEARPMRWVVVAGPIAPGDGPATERGGEAFLAAREMIDRARRQRDGLLMAAGDREADELLVDLAPVLADTLAGLSPRQRTVARLGVEDRLRQAEIAERLGVSRATVSVTWARGSVNSIDRLGHAIRAIFSAGVQRAFGAS
jgi:RNA polymerase sigma factor (sigma-70 family)